MKPATLRRIRIASLLSIFTLAGVYAGLYLGAPGPGPAPPPPFGNDQPLVETLPAFRLPDLAGRERSIQEWSGHGLLINFWATWCAPCLREMPLLQTLHDERRDTNFRVIGIAVDRFAEVEAFLRDTGISYPILVGQQDAMDAGSSFGPEFVGLPFSVLVAPGGHVLGLHAGELDAGELRALIETLDRVVAGDLDTGSARKRLATP